jgi:protein Mpv17
MSAFWILALLSLGQVGAWAPVTSRLQLTPRSSSFLSSSYQQHRPKAFRLYVSSSQTELEATVVDPHGVDNVQFEDLENSLFLQQDPAIDNLQEKLINGLILGVSFGYVAYTVLNIDHGMMRGWTQTEVAMRIPLDNWSNYESSLADKPVETKTLINVVIYLLGDWLSQTVFQKKNVLDYDPWRVVRNGFIGLCFGPLVHEYYQFSDYILPVEGGIWNRIQKILMDQTIYLTVKCSIYILAVGLLQGDDWDTALGNVKSRIKSIIFTAWKFWPLVHCITYSVIPARHRILWVNSVDLVWNAILSSMAAAKPVEEEGEEVAILLAAEPAALHHEQELTVYASLEREIVDHEQELLVHADHEQELLSHASLEREIVLQNVTEVQ